MDRWRPRRPPSDTPPSKALRQPDGATGFVNCRPFAMARMSAARRFGMMSHEQGVSRWEPVRPVAVVRAASCAACRPRSPLFPGTGTTRRPPRCAVISSTVKHSLPQPTQILRRHKSLLQPRREGRGGAPRPRPRTVELPLICLPVRVSDAPEMRRLSSDWPWECESCGTPDVVPPRAGVPIQSPPAR